MLVIHLLKALHLTRICWVQEAAQSWVGNDPSGLLHEFAQDSPYNTVPFPQSTGFKLAATRAANSPTTVIPAVGSAEAMRMMRGLQNVSPDGMQLCKH